MGPGVGVGLGAGVELDMGHAEAGGRLAGTSRTGSCGIQDRRRAGPATAFEIQAQATASSRMAGTGSQGPVRVLKGGQPSADRARP